MKFIVYCWELGTDRDCGEDAELALELYNTITDKGFTATVSTPVEDMERIVPVTELEYILNEEEKLILGDQLHTHPIL
jgi:hypothetical protein